MTNKNQLNYEDLELANYLNTSQVIGNLDVVDLVKAAVLSPLNVFLVGSKGTGKTQLFQDIYRSYFGGNKKENGQGIFIRAHPEIDIYNEIFTELNVEKAKRALTDNIDAAVYVVEEINRAPTKAQNQFFGLGDGAMDHDGRLIKIGKDGYRLLIANANLGNGSYQGTFDTDEALLNRLHVTLDLDHESFKPTIEDKLEIRHRQSVDPNVKEAPIKDISGKIITVSREISEKAHNPGIEALAVANYIEFGLDNCMKNKNKGKVWPMDCQGCTHNQSGNALCSYLKSPVERTMQAMIKYAAALDYLSKLKDKNQNTDAVDMMFKSFELTGAYQSLLNPMLLRQDYLEQNPKFMAEVAKKLKDDFRANEDFILTSIDEAASNGKKTVAFFEKDGKFGSHSDLPENLKGEYAKIEPYTNGREIGLGWVNNYVDFLANQRKGK